MRKFSIALIIIMITLSLVGCVKVVKIGEENIETEINEYLDVAAFWDTDAVPEIKENAIGLADFLIKSEGKLDSLGHEYGHYTMGDSGNLSYAVHITGTIEEVNTENKAGYIAIKLAGYQGDEVIKVQIGTVFKNTTIRDYLSFIDINNYSDQIEYAQLSKNINAYILENVIGEQDFTTTEGKQVDIYGCFTVADNTELLVTPVTLDVSE